MNAARGSREEWSGVFGFAHFGQKSIFGRHPRRKNLSFFQSKSHSVNNRDGRKPRFDRTIHRGSFEEQRVGIVRSEPSPACRPQRDGDAAIAARAHGEFGARHFACGGASLAPKPPPMGHCGATGERTRLPHFWGDRRPCVFLGLRVLAAASISLAATSFLTTTHTWAQLASPGSRATDQRVLSSLH